jgi:hypothetical protein
MYCLVCHVAYPVRHVAYRRRIGFMHCSISHVAYPVRIEGVSEAYWYPIHTRYWYEEVYGVPGNIESTTNRREYRNKVRDMKLIIRLN